MWFRVRSAIHHFITAGDRYSVHSPFVYRIADEVLRAIPDSTCHSIERERRHALRDNRVLSIEDFGAGYGGVKQPYIQKQVREVVQSSACSLKEGSLLYHLRRHLRPEYSLELGTNLGFSAWYQLEGYSGKEYVTVEGSSALSHEAALRLSGRFPHADLRCGEFGALLPDLCTEAKHWDWVYMDGNHRYDPMMEYTRLLLPAMTDGACLLVDDIYWSEEMNRFWLNLIRMEEVTISLDLYHIGICFIRRNQAREHFRLRW